VTEPLFEWVPARGFTDYSQAGQTFAIQPPPPLSRHSDHAPGIATRPRRAAWARIGDQLQDLESNPGQIKRSAHVPERRQKARRGFSKKPSSR